MKSYSWIDKHQFNDLKLKKINPKRKITYHRNMNDYNELVNIPNRIESHIPKNENKLKKDLSLIFNNAMKHEGSFNSKDVS